MAIERTCRNKQEAHALANFLWNEKQRHLRDIYQIEKDLAQLRELWSVVPAEREEFVKP